MTLIKGILIFSPIFFSELHLASWKGRKKKLGTVVITLLGLTILFSPISFIGWLFDYLTFFIGMTLILNGLLKNKSMAQRAFVYTLTVLMAIGYTFFSSRLGPHLVDEYKKQGFTFRLYEVPDMVIAPTHRLQVTKTWGIFERNILNQKVLKPRCRFEYNNVKNELVPVDNC